MKLTEAKLKQMIMEVAFPKKPELPKDFPMQHLDKLKELTYESDRHNNPEKSDEYRKQAAELFAALGYKSPPSLRNPTGNYFLDMKAYEKQMARWVTRNI